MKGNTVIIGRVRGIPLPTNNSFYIEQDRLAGQEPIVYEVIISEAMEPIGFNTLYVGNLVCVDGDVPEDKPNSIVAKRIVLLADRGKNHGKLEV